MFATTSLYAALLTFVYLWLSAHVASGRRQYALGIGDGGHDDMKTRIRAHGNFIEYTPLFLILLALIECQGFSRYIIHAFGILFLLGRLSHAYGILAAEPKSKNYKPRICGMLATFGCLAGLAMILVARYFL